MECIPTRSVGTIGNGIGNRGFDGCADPVGAGLLANAVDMAGRWRLTKCVRQQAGSYSRLHSASETNADGEIGVSREWTRSVLGCISTRTVGTIGNGIGNRGFDGCADPVGAGLLANAVDLAGRWRLTKCVRQQAGSYSRLHSASKASTASVSGTSAGNGRGASWNAYPRGAWARSATDIHVLTALRFLTGARILEPACWRTRWIWQGDGG